MNAQTAIRNSLETAEMICMSYLSDLSDEQMMQRPHPKCNHLNWQVGHLIASEYQMVNQIAGGKLPELPAGFADMYGKETAGSDVASDFKSKDELLAIYKQQRAATLAVLAEMSDEDFDAPSGIDYAPTAGSIMQMQGAHWLMHCGQWVIVRRECDKPVMI